MKHLISWLLCGLALQAQATTLVHKDFKDLVQEADGIIAGTVEEVVSKRAEDKQIYTYITLTDLDVLSGYYQDGSLTLMLEGGFDGREGLDIEGSPEFLPKQRVVLFIAGNGHRLVPLVGWGQGMFRLVVDPKTGKHLVTDEVGNFIYGISDKGQILKARKRAPRAEILRAPEPDRNRALHIQRNEPPKFSPGEADDGTPVEPSMDLARNEPMSAERFLKEVIRRTKASKFQTELHSVAIGQPLKRMVQDAIIPGQKPGSAQVPSQPFLPKRLTPEVIEQGDQH